MPKVPRPKNAPEANRPWSDNEFETVLANAPEGIRIALVLGGLFGLREGDALRCPWSSFDGSHLEFATSKTGRKIRLPAHHMAIKVFRDASRRSPVMVTGVRGRPFTESGFRTMFFRLLKRLEGEGVIGCGLTFHGLRHTVGGRLAEAGADTRTIADWLGQETLAMADLYSRRADASGRIEQVAARLELNRNRNGKLSTENGKPRKVAKAKLLK